MSSAHDETARLHALYRHDVLDTPAEEAFDRITRLASLIAEAPIALVSLVDRDRQWFKSRVGLEVAQTSREVSFCAHAIEDGHPFVVRDACADPRFSANPLVTGEPRIRFYLGVPLTVDHGVRIGTLCVIDRTPRRLSAAQVDALSDLAAMATRELELRRVALSDALTGAFNRRMAIRMLDGELARHARGGPAFSVALFDLDHFKHVNDQHGHAAGDQVLVEVARRCQEVLRREDTLYRVGGEEFLVLAVGAGRREAAAIAERVRAAIAERPIEVATATVPMTASVGVVEVADGDLPGGLLARADQALYAAKAGGRDRVVVGD